VERLKRWGKAALAFAVAVIGGFNEPPWEPQPPEKSPAAC
jgi:hypothetical protein